MVLNDKVYEVLKWLLVIVLPAIGTLYTGLAELWGFPLAAEVAATLDYVGTFLGIVLGISSINYKKKPLNAEDTAQAVRRVETDQV